MPRPTSDKLAEYKYVIVYKTGKINANPYALTKNSTPILKVSEKIDPKEPPPCKSLHKKFPIGGTVTDSGLEET